MAQNRDTLVTTFNRHGYRTVALMPGLRSSWPEGAFYGFDHIYDTKALDYRGPRFGWWTVPDQFALARLDALEGSRPGVPREPLFVFFPTTSTHAPFGPTAPYEPDWNRVTSATPYDDADVEAARARTPKWFDLGPSYANAVGYMYASIGGYLRRHAGRPLVMVVIGDHQPAAAVSGEGASWDVPVHVIAPPGLLLDRLRARGFRPGLTPGRPHLGPMHDLLPTLLDAFGDTRRDTRGHAPTRSPATE
jgi:phosphoglycerol transferase MdoB-like AlkP superfamily enzyme